MKGERFALVTQFAIAAIIGSVVYTALIGDANPLVPLAGGLICGFAGQWLVMFLYVALRYGWRAARSLRMDPSDPEANRVQSYLLTPGDKRLRSFKAAQHGPRHAPQARLPRH